MNIQINVGSEMRKEDLINSLNVVAYSVDSWIKEYEGDKWGYSRGRQMSGTLFTRTNMQVKCNGKTMFVKIKPLDRKGDSK